MPKANAKGNHKEAFLSAPNLQWQPFDQFFLCRVAGEETLLFGDPKRRTPFFLVVVSYSLLEASGDFRYGRARTCDHQVKSPMLFQLSYIPTLLFKGSVPKSLSRGGFEPPTQGVEEVVCNTVRNRERFLSFPAEELCIRSQVGWKSSLNHTCNFHCIWLITLRWRKTSLAFLRWKHQKETLLPFKKRFFPAILLVFTSL